MRLHILAAIGLLTLAAATVDAKPPALPASSASSSMRVSSPSGEAGESALVEHGHYVTRSGITVHSPAHSLTGAAPAGASAQCRDGSYSFSQHRQGTCSRHGGVAAWL